LKSRYLALVAAVLLLAVLNTWQWRSPGETRDERSAIPAGGFRPEDFRLKVGFATPESARISRNLFQPWRPSRPPAPMKKVEAPPPPPPGPPPKTPEQLAEEAARAELGQIKLVGVVFRRDKGQAFLVRGEQLYMVHAGEKIGERFRVEAIRADSVQLIDPATHVNGQIPVSGK
jgi:hypothetical protein